MIPRKLGPHFLVSTSDGMRLAKSGVAVVKFVGIYGGADELAALPPETRPRMIIGREYEGEFGIEERRGTPPAQYADYYFRKYLEKSINANPSINAWEGPNEPTAQSADGMTWYAEFLYELSRLVRALGKTAVIGGWAVGNPDYPFWQYYGRALHAVRDHGAVLGRHSYGGPDQSSWPDLLLRHRRDNAIFESMGYPDLPVVLTECGADDTGTLGNPPGKSWRDLYGNGSDGIPYANEIIIPLEMELRKDNYVIGGTIFTYGGQNSWPRHNVDGTRITSILTALPPPQEIEQMDKDAIMTALQAHLDAAREHITQIINHVVQAGILATQLAGLAHPPPAPVAPYIPKVINQTVFDALGIVGKNLGLNMIALMPYDLMIWMLAHRKDTYAGQPVQQWGLSDEQKNLIIEEIKKHTP